MRLYPLDRAGTDPRQRHRIQRDIRRIDDLVSGLLRFTHAGLRDEPTTIELHDLLDECIADFQPFAEDHEIQVENDYTIDELRVLGSPSQLRVLISNLLRNALDAAGFAGTIRIETRICGQQIEIDVQDSGPGIPAGLEERIFELSFSTKPGGTGLGLALARREAEQLGGQIKILPAPGQGTLLRVVLPRVI
jgi:signal transduction histidine kinase